MSKECITYLMLIKRHSTCSQWFHMVLKWRLEQQILWVIFPFGVGAVFTCVQRPFSWLSGRTTWLDDLNVRISVDAHSRINGAIGLDGVVTFGHWNCRIPCKQTMNNRNTQKAKQTRFKIFKNSKQLPVVLGNDVKWCKKLEQNLQHLTTSTSDIETNLMRSLHRTSESKTLMWT